MLCNTRSLLQQQLRRSSIVSFSAACLLSGVRKVQLINQSLPCETEAPPPPSCPKAKSRAKSSKEASPTPKITVLEQYRMIQRDYPNYVILFQVGDFFEVFDDAAKQVSRVLEIGICDSRYGTQMTGFPMRSMDTYLERLVKNGSSVVLVEQFGVEKEITRKITRIVTPGTLTEENLLESKSNNFILSLTGSAPDFGLAWIDLSTGFFRVLQVVGPEDVYDELLRISPSEIVLSGQAKDGTIIEKYRQSHPQCSIVHQETTATQQSSLLHEYFGEECMEDFGKLERCAADRLLQYVQTTQLEKKPYIELPRRHNRTSFMHVDAAALRSLEILKNNSTNSRENSLLDVLDVTCTAAGSRALIQRLQSPLTNIKMIEERLDAIEFFMTHSVLTSLLREHLSNCKDLERCFQRLALNRSSGGPRDMAAIRQTLREIVVIKDQLSILATGCAALEQFARLDGCPEIVKVLSKALEDPPPYRASDGKLIREGYSDDLDQLRGGHCNLDARCERLLARYRAETKRKGMRVVNRKTLGWVLEVNRSDGELNQGHFILEGQSEKKLRYRTAELASLNRAMNSSDDDILREELRIYEELRSLLINNAKRIMSTAKVMAELDVTLAMAVLARERRLVRPTFTDGHDFEIIRGRHPVVEYKHMEDSRTFVNNSCDLGPERRFALITGPNMGGKSTFLRQNALITIMAQCGMHVPAERCTLGIVDAVFTRIGASDDLSRDRSTFMVEMIETANILNNATGRSLVIMDEIGRGTSAKEGFALAWGICQFLYGLSCRTLFATHYSELAQLIGTFKASQCLMTAARIDGGNFYFLHQIFAGVSTKSHAIEIARLAGIPASILKEATLIADTSKFPDGDAVKSNEPKPRKSSSMSARKRRDNLLDSDIERLASLLL